MPAEIRIKIGADIGELVAKAATTERIMANDLPAAAQKTGAAFGKISDQLDVSKLELQEVSKQLGILNTALTRTADPSLIKGYESAIAKLEDRMLELKTTANASFKQITPAVKESTQVVKDLTTASVSTSGGFAQVAAGANNAFGVIRKIAFILPGIGIAGIFGLIGDAIIKLATGETDASKAADELAKHQAELNEVISKAAGTALGEAEQVRILARAVTDATLPYVERKRALDELKNINKAYFGDLTVEEATYGRLQKKVEDYTKALILNAVQKAKGETLTKATIDLTDVRRQLQDLDELIRNRQEKIKDNFAKLQANALAANLATAQSTNDLIARDPKILALGKQRLDLYQKLGAATEEAGKRAIEFEDATRAALSVPLIKPPKDTTTKTEIDDLKKQIAALEQLKKELGQAFTTADEFKLTNLKITLENLEPKLTSEEKTRFVEKLKADFFSSGISLKIKTTQVSFEGSIRDNLQKELDKGLDVTKAFKKNGGFDKTGDATFTDQILRANEQLDATREKGQKLADFLTGTLGTAFQDLFKDIISGSTNAFQAFGNAISAILQKLIAAAIEAALFAAIITIATGGAGTSANPGGFFTQFKSLFSGISGLPKFAEGGIASGPKSGFLAVLHGNELVVPLDKAKQGIGTVSSADDRIITGKITAEGDKLVTLINVVQKRKGRTG